MEHVIEIMKQSGGRYRISLESGLQFPLYGKELQECGICEGGEISEDTLAYIMEDLLPKRARLRSMHLLEKMDRTESQLRQKLRQSSYPEEIIDDALRYVKNFHYVDDLRYARNYLENHADVKSLREMEQALYVKGISKEIIEQAISEIELPDEEKQITALLVKKHYDPGNADPKEQRRMYAFLMRRGYHAASIAHVLHYAQD
ncbi:MAG: RecX family transcriptional regulator [Clostridiales bacterium]|nr:RecX family transcriptional regulator [Clostridiales bacterium]